MSVLKKCWRCGERLSEEENHYYGNLCEKHAKDAGEIKQPTAKDALIAELVEALRHARNLLNAGDMPTEKYDATLLTAAKMGYRKE